MIIIVSIGTNHFFLKTLNHQRSVQGYNWRIFIFAPTAFNGLMTARTDCQLARDWVHDVAKLVHELLDGVGHLKHSES